MGQSDSSFLDHAESEEELLNAYKTLTEKGSFDQEMFEKLLKDWSEKKAICVLVDEVDVLVKRNGDDLRRHKQGGFLWSVAKDPIQKFAANVPRNDARHLQLKAELRYVFEQTKIALRKDRDKEMELLMLRMGDYWKQL